MHIERFFIPGLANASYLVASGNEAVAVDPERNVDGYLAYLSRNKLNLDGIFLTHPHADFVAGHTELSARSGASIFISDKAPATFVHKDLKDGDRNTRSFDDAFALAGESLLQRLPRVTHPGRMPGQGFRSRQRGRRLIARRQNDAVCFHGGGIREANDDRVACGFDVQDLARDKLRRDRGHAVRALQMMVHDGAQIVAVHHAWNEALAQLDFRHGVELRASAQPSQEMIRLISKSGHIPRGNVQQVFRASRAIGNASPRRTAAIDHRHLERTRAESRQIHRGH
jgi:glyoxylase-like metal-dependent hydrolase (beta-lactamase superfamily II)